MSEGSKNSFHKHVVVSLEEGEEDNAVVKNEAKGGRGAKRATMHGRVQQRLG